MLEGDDGIEGRGGKVLLFHTVSRHKNILRSRQAIWTALHRDAALGQTALLGDPLL